MSNEEETKNSKKITRKDLNKVFWRLQIWGLNVTMTLVLTQGIGFLNAMVPIIRRLYGDNKELRIEAMKRHLTYFLSQITATGMILGITAAVEETTSEDEKEAVVAIKAGMMGPLAGIGDSVFKITIQAIAGSIGAAYALQGNVLGPILMFVIYNGINIVVKYYGIIFGYEKGTEFIKSGNQKKVMQKIINISTAIGVMVIGALIAQYVKINVGTVIYTKGTKIVIQKLLDGVMPKLLPLLFTLGLYKLHSYLPRKYLTWLIFAILILGTVLAVMGIIK